MTRNHWEEIYSEYDPGDVSWYQETPLPSLDLIKNTGIESTAKIIDVGAGASTLVDHLLTREYQDISVLDISASALEVSKARLGSRAESVEWIVADVTRFEPSQSYGKYDLWHDRAVFHFLTQAKDRSRYLDAVARSLGPRGHLIIGTFALDGPEKCSGLEVARYDSESLAKEVGPSFRLIESLRHSHEKPWGGSQAFIFCRFQKNS